MTNLEFSDLDLLKLVSLMEHVIENLHMKLSFQKQGKCFDTNDRET